ncbi:MAG: GlsB/YeaQ/YmgE family stress response membrane protein [Rhodanobacteraceae bacterium]|nr:GlsB/YeaQ/YmgE family stress response membrane protein [Rhodanobacteraceae bacterium]MBL0040682.1 GlsB/YeaQ/YmgE family stress response membrane protein [Xanthomonadales bacterium]
MTIESLLIFLVIGAIAGWLAGQLIRGGGFGLVGNIVVGVVGAFVGGFVFGRFGFLPSGILGAILSATLGAVLLIALIRVIKRA